MRTEGSTLTFRGALRVADDITDLVGQTPMLRLTRLCSPEMAEVFAKLEFLNPGGSVKDRAALGMILRAEQEGLIAPGAQIFEATAGNTGVGLALIGVNRGYKVTLFVPEGYAEEKCILMRGFGAKVIRTPEKDGMQGAIDQAQGCAGRDSRIVGRLSVREPGESGLITKRPPRPRFGSRWRAAWMRWWRASAPAAPSPASRAG